MDSKLTSENLVLTLSFKFALKIVAYTEQLEILKRYNVANQLFRCGTSIGANVREAQGAESLNDFIHKIKVAYKEAQETSYWLEICSASENYPKPGLLINEIQSILRVLGKILTSSISKKVLAGK